MAFDYQNAIAQAVASAKGSSSENTQNYTYPLVYPSAGSTLVVRILFNPKSGQIVRLVNRHEKTACLKTYGVECPICKVMEDVKNMTGQDPFGRTKASRSRGIALAEFVSSTTEVKKGNQNVQPGEIVLLMFPWSVYSAINEMIQAIAQTPTGMDMAFGHANTGMFVQITVTSDFKYTCVQIPYMVSPIQRTDEQFLDMLEKCESLNEMVLPSTINEEVSKSVQEYADSIYRQYMSPSIPNQGVPAGTQPQTVNVYSQNPQVQPSPTFQNVVTPAVVQTSPTVAPYVQPAQYVPQNQAVPPFVPNTSNGMPACFGNHKDGDPTCICCPVEMQCIEKK